MLRTSLLATLVVCLAACTAERPEGGDLAAAPVESIRSGSEPGSSGTQEPTPLGSADFVVDGLGAGLSGPDSTGVLRALGAPDSVVTREAPSAADEEDALRADWHYRDLTVHFTGLQASHGFTLTGPSRLTYRGARVGDSAARVRELYGEPFVVGNRWYYIDPADELEEHVVFFTFRDDRVAEIFLGNILD